MRKRKYLIRCLAVLAAVLMLGTAGCGETGVSEALGESALQIIEEAAADAVAEASEGAVYEDDLKLVDEEAEAAEEAAVVEPAEEAPAEEEPAAEAPAEEEAAQPEEEAAEAAEPEEREMPAEAEAPAETEEEPAAEEPALDVDGVYTSKEDVALYIYLYGELPQNFITKKEAQKLGWPGGSLDEYAYGKCIGGDHFGNYEGILPKKAKYRECDIDTLHKKKRGAKRIIYSDDGHIYYTDDHYESFELLYEGGANGR